MKNSRIIFSILAVFLFSGNVFAAYVGGPLKTIGQGKWDFTLESGSIKDRDMVSPETSSTKTTGVIEERNSINGKVTYGISDQWDVYFKFGSSELEVDTRWPDASRTRLKYDEANLFGGGVKYIYTFDNDLLIGGDFQFVLQQGIEIKEITENSTKAVITRKGEADLEEYQLSFFCGKKYIPAEKITLIPYAGILFNGLDFSSDRLEYNTWPWTYTIAPFELEQDDNVGLFTGADIIFNDRLFFSVEAHFIADERITGSISYRF